MKLCKRCQAAEAMRSERYCALCRKEVLRELNEVGYLTPRVFGYPGSQRTHEMKEDQHETRRGRD
jgi:hypothetical protein